MMHEELKILDVIPEGDGFTVVFEVPGDVYDLDYPKRLRHGFPPEERWMDDVEFNGETMKRFERHLRERYLDESPTRNRDNPAQVKEKIQKAREDVKGRVHERKGAPEQDESENNPSTTTTKG